MSTYDIDKDHHNTVAETTKSDNKKKEYQFSQIALIYST